MAAGVTLRKGALAEWRAFLEAALAADVEIARRASGLLIDGAVTAAAADADLVNMIGRAGPFGSGNPEPLIALPAHTVTYAEEVGQAHMRVRLKSADGTSVNAVAFRASGRQARRCPAWKPRPADPRRRLLRARSLARRGAGAVSADRHRAGRAVRRALTQSCISNPRIRGLAWPPPSGYLRTQFDAIQGSEMAKLNLSVAVGDYDRTRALIDGSVQIDGVDPVYMTLVPEEIFFRAFRAAEFDICELSLSSYTVKTAQGNCPYIAVPAFVSRAFRHTSVYVRTDRIKKPQDLKGRKVGVPEYQLTANVWARSFLEDDYGVKRSDIHWIRGGIEEAGRPEKITVKSASGREARQCAGRQDHLEAS